MAAEARSDACKVGPPIGATAQPRSRTEWIVVGIDEEKRHAHLSQDGLHVRRGIQLVGRAEAIGGGGSCVPLAQCTRREQVAQPEAGTCLLEGVQRVDTASLMQTTQPRADNKGRRLNDGVRGCYRVTH
eukprot:scaffold243717_cov33-Tisochrysis_lutea.AAC.2